MSQVFEEILHLNDSKLLWSRPCLLQESLMKKMSGVTRDLTQLLFKNDVIEQDCVSVVFLCALCVFSQLSELRWINKIKYMH